MLKGPPGSPLGLCSGTIITSIKLTPPFWFVPQTGQFWLPTPFPQLTAKKEDPSSTAKARTGSSFDFIALPPAIFLALIMSSRLLIGALDTLMLFPRAGKPAA
jgi:hypothetical protein